MIYIQFNCDFAKEKEEMQKLGLFISLIGIVGCIIYNLTIYSSKTTASLDEKMWDVQTVTTADFTVEVEINKEVWDKWLDYKSKMNSSPENLDKELKDYYPDFQMYF